MDTEYKPVERFAVSEQDVTNMDILCSAGYGWGEYANSVRQQGWISAKQKDTLQNMVRKYRLQCSINLGRRSRVHEEGCRDYNDCSDYGGVGENW